MATATFNPSSLDEVNSVFKSKQNSNRVGSSTSASYGTFYIPTGAGAQMIIYYNFDFSSLPQNIIINSMQLKVKEHSTISSWGSGQYGLSLGLNNFIGETGAPSIAISTVSFAGPTGLTRSDLDNIKFLYQITRASSSNAANKNVYSRLYGWDLVIDYTVVPWYIYIKDGDNFIQQKKVYHKVNGAWVEKSNFSEIFATKQNWKINE